MFKRESGFEAALGIPVTLSPCGTAGHRLRKERRARAGRMRRLYRQNAAPLPAECGAFTGGKNVLRFVLRGCQSLIEIGHQGVESLLSDVGLETAAIPFDGADFVKNHVCG